MMKRPLGWVLASALALWTLILNPPVLADGREPSSSAPATSAPSRPSAPNIILIMVDALRADGLGVYGNPRALSPTVDALAAEGVVFERTIAQAPWTLPSVVSLFCSRYPTAHGVTTFRKAKSAVSRAKESHGSSGRFLPTLADSLRAGGYSTAAFVANPYLRRGIYLTQGFDHYDASFARNTMPGSAINVAAIRWLNQRDASKPFFIYLHYMDVHGPYDAGPEYLDELLDAVEKLSDKHELSPECFDAQPPYIRRMAKRATNPDRHKRLEKYGEYWVARYEAGIREMDHYVSGLRSRLQTLGLWDDAYVIITSDHGEALGEHNLWHHGLSAHHTDLHVPLILRWPGHLPAGKRVRETVRLIDLMPTLLQQLHLPSVTGLQGESRCDHIAGRSPQKPDAVLAEAVKHKPSERAVYFGEWKMMILNNGRSRLYHVASDPSERSDVAARHPEQLRTLRAMLKEQIDINKRLAKGVDVEPAPLTPEDVARLEALGYVE